MILLPMDPVLEPVTICIPNPHELVLDDEPEEGSRSGRSKFHEACREDIDVIKMAVGLH